MSDERDDEKILEFDLNSDQPDKEIDEINEAAQRFFQALQNKQDSELQKQIERLSTEELKRRVVALAVSKFEESARLVSGTLAVIKMLEQDEVIEGLITDHVQLQVRVLSKLIPGMPTFDQACVSIRESEDEYIAEFIKEHSGGAHKGCIMDEYCKRQSEWPDQVEEVGGEPC